MNRNIIIIALFLFSGQFVIGQASNTNLIFSPKFGVFAGAGSNGASGFVAGLEFSTTINEKTFSLDYYKFNEIEFFADGPSESYNQLGLMVGQFYQTKNRFLKLELQGGLAPTWGRSRTNLDRNETYDYERLENFFTVGLVGKVGLNIMPLEKFGIGLDIQTNINSKNPMLLFMISMDIGKVK